MLKPVLSLPTNPAQDQAAQNFLDNLMPAIRHLANRSGINPNSFALAMLVHSSAVASAAFSDEFGVGALDSFEASTAWLRDTIGKGIDNSDAAPKQ